MKRKEFQNASNQNAFILKSGSMNYDDTLKYLLEQLPMYQRDGATAYREGLETSHALDKYLSFPHKAYKCIHIAGTNGKGSVAHLLASYLQQSGLKVGLHTSPHYTDYRERIKVNGNYIEKEAVTEFVKENRVFIDQLKPSFFEISVFMAFWYFKKCKVDYAVIEVGMGGRLDATNVITPELAVITNISLDHTMHLGNTKAKIAGEKAGIIKAKAPTVVGEKNKETNSVFEAKTAALDSSLYYAEELATEPFLFDRDDVSFALYQKRNIVTVIAALKVLKLYDSKKMHEAIENLIVNTGYFGRWQVLQKKPLLILDAAHNEAGLKNVFNEIHRCNVSQVFVLFSLVNDKNVSSILSLLPKEYKYVATSSSVDRSLPSGELTNSMKNCDLDVVEYSNPMKGLEFLLGVASKEDLILVCGSSFLVADILKEKKNMF
jgi:dihydrofolate synthase/folylpolyglutamate synthase